MPDNKSGREDRPVGAKRFGAAGKSASDPNGETFRKVMEENIPERTGTDPKDIKTPALTPANEPLNPPAVTNEVKEAAKDSPDQRTKAMAQDTGTTPPKPQEEGEYRDPDSVGPNPDVEAFPGQKPTKRAFGFNPTFEGNLHQVYPEAAYGTTPTDPDIREEDKVGSGDQLDEMRARRHVVDRAAGTTEKPLDLTKGSDRLARRRHEFATAVPPGPEKQAAFTGGLTTLQANQQYKVRADQLGSGWWRAKYNTFPTITIEGTLEDVLGYQYGDRSLNGHYLLIEYNDRRNAMPKGHPIRKDDREIYIGTVSGNRVLVHGFELEEAESKD